MKIITTTNLISFHDEDNNFKSESQIDLEFDDDEDNYTWNKAQNKSRKYKNLLEASAVVDLESDDAFEVGGNMLSKIIGRVNLWVDSASISDCNIITYNKFFS